jgi:two-component system, chemotaxis family, response regulator Rcp1
MLPIQVLLVEDNPADARLTREVLADSKLTLDVCEARDGEEAIEALRRAGGRTGVRLPDLILLDLNLPRMDGREVLAEIKSHTEWKSIPVVVLTSSKAEKDIVKSYQLHANCYITKPIDLMQMQEIVQNMKDFWFTVVRLPSESSNAH